MTDLINTDGTAADTEWEARKWGPGQNGANNVVAMPDPLAPEFALSDADRAAVKPINVGGGWARVGDWKWREWGREVQLRNLRLPHLPLDLFRGEVEALAFALGLILSKPMPLPYRSPWRERLRMWWLRRVWNRKHARELDEAREALVADTLRQFPQIEDGK